MARERANIRTDMLSDDDFRSLSMDAQHLYLILLIHPTLSYAGVADWRAGRIAALTKEATPESVQTAAEELQAKHFIYVDTRSEEVLVRSFVRHDGLLKQYRLPTSMANAYAGIASPLIRQFFAFELQRLHKEMPSEKCWELPRVAKILTAPARNMKGTQGNACGKGYAVAYGNSSDEGYAAPCGDLSDEGYAVTSANDSAETTGDATRSATTTATTTATSSKEDTSSSEVADATPRPDVQRLLDLLDQRIAENGAKVPSRTKKNEDAARLLLDRDKHTVEQVEWMIRWATNDEFWRGNILSMSKLRDKFPQLLLKSGAKPRGQQTSFDGSIDIDAILGKDYWTPPAPPAGLSLEEEKAWKADRRAEHKAGREKLAREKLEAQHG